MKNSDFLSGVNDLGTFRDTLTDMLKSSERHQFYSYKISPYTAATYLTYNKGFNAAFEVYLQKDKPVLVAVLTNSDTNKTVRLLMNVESGFKQGFILIKDADHV